MPSFDYECSSCEHVWEEHIMVGAEAPTECPVCGCSEIKKLFSGGGHFKLRGSGFHNTEYGGPTFR
jgi:putative FmdB family regulatory protein